MNWHGFAFFLALAVSYMATPMVRRLALRLNVMVNPGGRRVHARPMPLWGGIAIFAGFVISVLIAELFRGLSPLFFKAVLPVLVASTIIVTVGLLDDMKEFSAAVQMLAIIVAAVVLIQFGIRIQFLTNPFGGEMIWLPTSVSWILTLGWIFLTTKTVDFMDGLDGLAAGIGAIASGVLAIMAYYMGQPHVAFMAAGLSGACIGFLRFNFNPAKIFMGTAGSQLIGFVLAALSIIGAFKVAAAMAIAIPMLVLGVPIFDGLFVIIKRVFNRQPIHIADRSHLHHRLLDRGLTHKQAVIVICVICLVLGGTALTIFWSIR